MPGLLVLQDLPAVILEEDSSKALRVEALGYDYYYPTTPQGYITFIRSFTVGTTKICQKIMKNQMSAIEASYSRHLINEKVLHDFRSSLSAATSDVLMILICGRIQQTKTQRRQPLDSVRPED
ncbi:hypothetical protein MMC22_003599 [Lobaria immixta]|nr:hypothetical protein [Lobaria immixta]